MSSTFEVPVISVHLEKHPNADSLSIVRIGGYQVVVKTDEWQEGSLGAYIPPDSVVPDREEYAFLDRKFRITTRRFRGEWSHGLLMPAPTGSNVGDNVADILGISRYEPPSSGREGLSSRQRMSLPWYRRIWSYYKELRERPRGKFPYYYIENFRRIPKLFKVGEPIIVTEKIHGANALYVGKKPWFGDFKIYMRSRTLWKHPFKRDWWQDAYKRTPGLERFLRDFPGMAVYGEVYGPAVQELDYGVSDTSFVAFDIFDTVKKTWMPQSEALYLFRTYDIPRVPVIYFGEYKGPEQLAQFIEDYKQSRLALSNGKFHVSEGIVIQTGGLQKRKILKLVSDYYLQGAK